MIAYDKNWIRVIDHVLDQEFCQHLIDRFNACGGQTRYSRVMPKTWGGKVRREDYPRLTELNLYNKNYRNFSAMELMRGISADIDFTEETELLVDRVHPVERAYRERWDHLHSFPNDFTMEGFRIKFYQAGSGDGFPIHTDAGSREMSTRFLAFLFYLNDSDAGTEFPLENFTVSARQGRLVIFPPGMQWPHIGHEPKQQDKYILSTYLHFI
jgi:hypothetical protein